MRKNKDNTVYYLSLIVSAVIFIWGVFFTERFETVVNDLLAIITTNFSWYYVLAMLSFFVFCIWIGFSKYGSIKLGPDHCKPDYSFASWFSMLFSAGLGIGLVFWGVAEPLNHYLHPLGMEGGTEAAKAFAMKKTFLHWGISAWSCYSVIALALAYMQFRKNKPALVSSLLIPLIGEKRASGLIGKMVDVLAVFATIAGVVTSLGLGTLQLNAGLNFLYGVPENRWVQVGIIAIITILFLTSATTGLDKGIQFLSNLNIGIAAFLLAAVFLLGPTMKILQNLGEGMLAYGGALLTENNNPFIQGEWYSQWTIFYWGWWIAWAPFVGIFIARISRGRTIREFIVGVILAPSFVCLLWFATFGTVGFEAGIQVGQQAIEKTELAYFVIMSQYPIGQLFSLIALGLLFTFFVTSADSATFVLGMLATGGDLNPPTSRKLVLGVLQSALTIALLFAGGLKMVQTASVVAAFPFGIIMILSMIAMIKSLREERIVEEVRVPVRRRKKEYGVHVRTKRVEN